MKTELKYLILALVMGVPAVVLFVEPFMAMIFFSAEPVVPTIPTWAAVLGALGGIPMVMFFIEVHKTREVTV